MDIGNNHALSRGFLTLPDLTIGQADPHSKTFL